MDQMNISITSRLAGYVRRQVKSGRYNNASEVVRDAIRRMQDDEEKTLRLAAPRAEDILADLSATDIDEIRRKVLAGLESIKKGDYVECADDADLKKFIGGVKTRGRQRLRETA